MSEIKLPVAIAVQNIYKCKNPNSKNPNQESYYQGVLELCYDGNFFAIDRLEAPLGEEFIDRAIESMTLVGVSQVNTLLASIVAVLEICGEKHLLNDADIQENCLAMVQATKDALLKKAAKQCDE